MVTCTAHVLNACFVCNIKFGLKTHIYIYMPLWFLSFIIPFYLVLTFLLDSPNPLAVEDQLVLVKDTEEDGHGGEDSDESQPKKRGGANHRVHVPIHKKVLAIRELDRLIEMGDQTSLEKKVMHTFPDVFGGPNGFKSGMLGRWVEMADARGWRNIPWEKMSQSDRESIKELPDWMRIPLGLLPRSLDRFKTGKQVPPIVVQSMVGLIERVTCGGSTSNLTAGTLKTKSLKHDCQELLDEYAECQKQACEEKGIEAPKTKLEVTEKWILRLLKHYGWKRNAPNTMGAYLDYGDERMIKSRKSWEFLRLGSKEY